MDKKILLAKRLQNQAKISNITQSDIANYLDISQPFVSDVLSGKKQLNGTIFEKLIDFLGFTREEKIDLQYLFVEVKTGFSPTNQILNKIASYLPGGLSDLNILFTLPENELYKHMENFRNNILNYIDSASHFVNNRSAEKTIQEKLIALYNKIKSVYKILPEKLKEDIYINNLLKIADTCNELVIIHKVI